MKNRFCFLVCLLLSAAGTLLAQGHWPAVNPHAYQYDMTAYVRVASGSGSALSQKDFEVAAFMADECRGVGKLLTATGGTQVFQLRIRSNEASGEMVRFVVCQASSGREYYPDCTVSFESQAVAGTPGEPLLLTVNSVLRGDVDGNGEITAQDASLVLQLVAGKLLPSSDGINSDAANVDGDSEVTAQDASLILQHVAGKINL